MTQKWRIIKNEERERKEEDENDIKRERRMMIKKGKKMTKTREKQRKKRNDKDGEKNDNEMAEPYISLCYINNNYTLSYNCYPLLYIMHKFMHLMIKIEEK